MLVATNKIKLIKERRESKKVLLSLFFYVMIPFVEGVVTRSLRGLVNILREISGQP